MDRWSDPERKKGESESPKGHLACLACHDGKHDPDFDFETYWARGASFQYVNDDGTVAPTAAGGSIVFAPELVVPTLMAMRDDHGEHLYAEYGFLDALNPTFTLTDVPVQHGRVVPGRGWYDTDYLGIDQGPILAMIENWRSGLVWDVMKRNPHVVRGLRRAGFAGGWLDAAPPAGP